MQEIQQLLRQTHQPVIKGHHVCLGCGEEVNVAEMKIAGGPNKGQVEEFLLGCKCEDRMLAEQAVQNDRRAKMRHFAKQFDDQSLVNEALKRASFENYQTDEEALGYAKQTLQQFVSGFNPKQPKNFLLTGSYGTGKSHLSYATAKALLDAGQPALFLSVPKLLTKIKETYNDAAKFSEAQLLEFVADVDLLVLDDLGAEYTNARNSNDNWVLTKLFEVVDGRSGKSTIYTTNLSSSELEDKVGTRNFSRIMDNTTVLKMNGKDYRRKAF